MVIAVGCPRCHRPVPADAPSGQCPACLLLLGLAETPDGHREGTVAVTVAAAAVEASGTVVTDPDATLTVGQRAATDETPYPIIPGYTIVRELGRGGGGAVYLAEQVRAGRRLVAVKVLHGRSRTERERMARETTALGLLTHPNVVRLFDCGDYEAGPYFAMEYLEGGSLSARLRRGPLPAEEAATIVEAVARGVTAAHGRGVRHRDLKPGNVLLDRDQTPKVADFGLAKLTETAGEETTDEPLTRTDHLLGTPAYMAPEQAGRRHGEVTDRTDVYGLGATLYHCLAGRPPYEGVDRADILAKVLTEELSFPPNRARAIPRELEAVCRKCLEKDQRCRYGSAEEVADELARWRRGEPTRVRPAGLVLRVYRRATRQARWVGATVVAVTLVVIAAAIGRHYRDRPDAPPEPPNELARIEKELAAGEEVELIRGDGTARYARWVSEATAPSEPAYHDTAFSIMAARASRVELLPAALVPRAYRLTALMRHDGTDQGNSAGGVYFACREAYLTDGSRFESGLACQMSDFPPTDEILPAWVKNRLFLCAWSQRFATGERADIAQGPLAGAPMPTPPLNQSRGWREVVIECRRDGIDYGWQSPDGLVRPQIGLVPAAIVRTTLGVQRRPVVGGGGAAGDDPDGWAGGGIGVLAIRGQVSVRRLSIVRLADE